MQGKAWGDVIPFFFWEGRGVPGASFSREPFPSALAVSTNPLPSRGVKELPNTHCLGKSDGKQRAPRARRGGAALAAWKWGWMGLLDR